MLTNMPDWIVDPLLTSTILAIAAFIFRGPLSSLFLKAVEYRFEKRLQDDRALSLANEKELEAIRSFLASRHIERQSMLEIKRLEAAEQMMKAAHVLSSLIVCVEVMKVIRIDKVSASPSSKIIEFFKVIDASMGIEEILKSYKEYDRTNARLYLSDGTLNCFDTYTTIVSYAALYVRAMSQGLDVASILKTDALSKKVIAASPHSKEGFEEYGEGYAFYWAQYFHDRMVASLRVEVSGEENAHRDTATIAKITASSLHAQMEARRLASLSNLPTEYLHDNTTLPTPPA